MTRLDLRLAGAAVAAWLTAYGCLAASVRAAAVVAVVAALALPAVLGLHRSWAPALALVLVAVAGAAVCTGLRVAGRDHGPLARLAADHATATLWLRLTGDPRPVGHARFGRSTVAVAARAVRVEADGRVYRTGGRVLVLADASEWAGLLPSQQVRADGRLLPPQGHDLTAAVLSARGPPADVGRPSLLQRAAGELRAGLRRACDPLPPEERGLLPGLVVGDTTRMDARLAEDFRTTGLTHLVAVSGTNCAIVVGAVLLLARSLRAGPRLSAGVAGVALVGFVVLARPSPSVLRAAVMGGLALVALVHGRSRAALPGLCAAVLGLVLVDPALARAPGFALSVLATAGLLLLAPGWRDLLRRRLPTGLAEALAVPAAAQLACAPVVVALSGQLSLVSVPANLLVVPAVAPATVLGVTAAVLSPAWAGGAALLVRLAQPPTWWLVEIAERGAALPGGTIGWPDGRGGGLALAGVLLLGALLLRLPRARRVVLAAAGAVVLVVVPVRVFAPGWPPPGWLLVACDVGQGDALVLSASRGSAVVVDTGPDPVLVDRCLARLHVDRVPLVVLTHLHADHVGGLAGVLRGRTVGGVAVGPLHEPVTAWREVVRLAHAARVPVVPARGGEAFDVADVRVQVLAPVTAYSGTRSDPNNSSLVLRVRARGHSLLLAGDVEVEAQHDLVSSAAPLRAEVLKVPHHGSAYQDPRFLRAVAPLLALVSVGADNDYGHPSGRTMTLLRRAGARVLRTDRSGDLAVAVDPGGGLVAVARGARSPAMRR